MSHVAFRVDCSHVDFNWLVQRHQSSVLWSIEKLSCPRSSARYGHGRKIYKSFGLDTVEDFFYVRVFRAVEFWRCGI